MESDEETLMLVIIAFVTHENDKDTHTHTKMKIWIKLWLLTKNQHGFCNYLLAEFRPEE